MMDTPIFVTLLVILQLIYWAVGRYASRKGEGTEDYFLAGKSVAFFPLMMTFLATQVGGGVILGAAEEAYLYGWPVLLYPLGAALGLILLGAGLGRKLAQFQITTVAQIFWVVYRSSMLRKAASLLSVISLFMILVAQIIASSKFLGSLGVTNNALFIGLWATVILYTAQGGLRAVISTDMVQAGFFTVLFFICFGFVLYTEPLAASMQLPHAENFAQVSSKLCGWLLMPLLFMVIEQDMAQRCFAGASPKIVSRASLVAGVITLAVCVVPVYFGCLAKSSGLEIPAGGSVLMTTIALSTNPWLSSLVGCAIIAAIISTATSLISAISSNVANDFIRIESVKNSQILTALLSMAAIFFAFYFDNIVDLLIQSYELSVSCLFVPIFIALFRREGSFEAALLSFLFGALGFFLFRLDPVSLFIPREVATILLSLLGYGVGEVLARCSRSLKILRE